MRDTQERAAYDSLRATTRAEVAQRGYGEEKILELHQRKRTLAGAVIEDANTLALTREDLIELLR